MGADKIVAASLSRRLGIPMANVFVSYRAARSGTVFDEGTVVHW